jgi:hypothetical protein
MRLSLAVAAFVALIAAAAAADFRYAPSSGEFSIDMSNPGDRGYKPGREQRSGHALLVDFWFGQGQLHGGLVQRTIEWVPLDQPMTPEQRDPMVRQLVSDYLVQRFGSKFALVDIVKHRDAEGRLVYLFVAKGEIDSLPSGWQGSVAVFDNAVALVSEVMSLNMLNSGLRNVPETDGVFDPELVRWAATLRPSRSPR